jgi:hypothetical protein
MDFRGFNMSYLGRIMSITTIRASYKLKIPIRSSLFSNQNKGLLNT